MRTSCDVKKFIKTTMIEIARISDLIFRSMFDFEHFMNLIERFIISQSKNLDKCFIMQRVFLFGVHQFYISNVNTYLQLIKKFHFKRRRLVADKIQTNIFKFVSHSYVISTSIFYFFSSNRQATNCFFFQLFRIFFILIMFNSAFNEDMHSHKKVFHSWKIFLSLIDFCGVVLRTFFFFLSIFFNKHCRCIYQIWNFELFFQFTNNTLFITFQFLKLYRS